MRLGKDHYFIESNCMDDKALLEMSAPPSLRSKGEKKDEDILVSSSCT